MAQLAELYDADKRTRVTQIRELAAKLTIPHPLNNVQYADGISSCRHARKHPGFQHCAQTVRPDEPKTSRREDTHR
ncbi:hypothetical protein [Arthrobacter bambusae]|uniref:Uncharacterized protein n=1 Tax=Arthrobacter bambusae TaxID=1338426 RepID=A0AAW8DBC2_9MICC|nr:hypothetical protein [Arthrobacter bambusae]MDP9903231.1 hypothetical protein [Arthrobacter bambusae]MDQ0128775.1 hypothetical protein [Arthrobacter bambusae]MDQ0180116.1 hypothetical protein [Arthrobacter bambusae]